MMRRCVAVVLCLTTALLVTAESRRKVEKFTPEFIDMLQTVLSHLKLDKSDLAKIGTANLSLAINNEVAVAGSTTSTHPPTIIPMPNTGESYCDKQSQATFQSYCHDSRMHTGVYVDPWDPYCGYIHCDQNGKATRHYCEKGSWTGFKATSHGRQTMCWRPLKLAENGRCTMSTFNPQMCRKAEWVVDYNNKVVEV